MIIHGFYYSKFLNSKSFSALIGLIIFLIVACDNDFQLTNPGQDTPVVYGLYDPNDTCSYIYLTKSFSGEESIDILAKQPNNLYYDSVNIKLDINTFDGYPITSLFFDRTILKPRQTGLFVSDPNIMYALQGPLDLFLQDGFQLRLIINIPGVDRIISSQQTYISPPEILSPRISKQTRLSLYSSDALKIKWVDKFGFQKYVLTIKFNYINWGTDFQDLMTAKIDFAKESQLSSLAQAPGFITHIFDGDDFLRRLGGKISSVEGVLNRSFVSIDIVISCLSKAFCDYTETIAIASDRLGKPVSNIVGGMGIFAYKAQAQQTGYLLDPISLDSLVTGKYTKGLKFVKW